MISQTSMLETLTRGYSLPEVTLLLMLTSSSTAGWTPPTTLSMWPHSGIFSTVCNNYLWFLLKFHSKVETGCTLRMDAVTLLLLGSWIWWFTQVLEMESLNFVSTLWSGTHGVCQLEDVDGEMVDIFLYDGDRLPVPRYYWKILFDPQAGAGVAVIGVNNPHLTVITSILCTSLFVMPCPTPDPAPWLHHLPRPDRPPRPGEHLPPRGYKERVHVGVQVGFWRCLNVRVNFIYSGWKTWLLLLTTCLSYRTWSYSFKNSQDII